MLSVYFDETVAAETEDFMKLIDKIPEEFDSKSKEFPPLLFAGFMLNADPLDYFLEQNKYSEKNDNLPSDCYFNLFRKTRHSLAWITKTRP